MLQAFLSRLKIQLLSNVTRLKERRKIQENFSSRYRQRNEKGKKVFDRKKEKKKKDTKDIVLNHL